jgi:UDP-N-acetylmuramate--alanine ligase
MKAVGTDIGTIHFVGIGGIGMSGIAEVMHQLGYKVQGSDNSESYVTEGLRKAGIPIMIGQKAGNLGDAAVVVTSTAIRPDNPEVEEAARRRIPRVRRAEMLAELMRMQNTVAVAGTHGKTTTTSMIAALLDAGGCDPTVINGGIINAYGSNARLGKGEWMVVEADESDGSFLRLDGTIAVVTNIDPEHLDHYGSFEAAKDAFVEFVENVPFYGLAVMCIDHPEVANLLSRIKDRRVVTYGFSASADLRAENVVTSGGITRFDTLVLERSGERRRIEGIALPMPGRHNVQNALAAVAVGLELGLSDDCIAHGFAKFGGVKRRFTRVGEVDGTIIIDDYAHHPVEIRAVLSAARDSTSSLSGAEAGDLGGRVIAVVQPHRYTRLAGLMQDFANAFVEADTVLVAPVYAAGEEPIEGVDSAALADAIRAHGHRMVQTVAGADDLARTLRDLAAEGDLVICMGAGDITKWAAGLEQAIRQERGWKTTPPTVAQPNGARAEQASAALLPLAGSGGGGPA